MAEVTLSKLDVARRQLETAIRLYFYDGDFVSTHTLAAAACKVLNDLTTLSALYATIDSSFLV